MYEPPEQKKEIKYNKAAGVDSKREFIVSQSYYDDNLQTNKPVAKNALPLAI